MMFSSIRFAKILALAGLTLFLAVGSVKASVLYGIDGSNGRFVTVNPLTGAATVVGSLGGGVVQPAGLAVASDGTVYMSDFTTDRLYTINTATGAATEVGPFGLGNTLVRGLSFNSGGTLFGVDAFGFDRLLTIDTVTGAASVVGSAGTPDNLAGLAFAPDGSLYAVDATTDNFFSVDPGTGIASLIGPTGSPTLEALTFDPLSGILYAADTNTNQLLTINTTTGFSTPVGLFGPTETFDITGLAFGPASSGQISEPTSLFAVFLGFLISVFRYRRSKVVS